MRRLLQTAIFRLTIVVGFVATLLAGGISAPAHAVNSGSKLLISGDNTFYAYVVGGETINAAFTKSTENEPVGLVKHDISVTLDGPGLQTQACTISKDVSVGQGCSFLNVAAPQTGIYRLAFNLPDAAKPYPEVSPTVKWGGNLFSWDMTIKDGATEKQGRVWSELYAVRQPIAESFLANLTYHYVSESGAIYRASYKGYNGQISTFSADAVGIRSGKECQSSYQSIDVTDEQRSPSFGTCGGSYKLFFEQPAGDLPQSAKQWDGKKTDWISPAVSAPKVSDLRFESDKNGDVQSGKVAFKLSNFVGQYSIDIDTTGDGSFTAKGDIKVKRTMKKVDNSLQEFVFDGVDARGQVVPSSQPIAIRINVEKVAEIHLVNADVEGRNGGLELVRLSGENAPSGRMCWNDTDLRPLDNQALQTKVLDGRDCPDSTLTALHGWAYATGSWGDLRYIDDWAYAATKVEGVSKIQYPEASEPIIATGTNSKQNVVIAIAGLILFGIFTTFIVVIIVKRRNKMRMLKQMQQQNFGPPGPGDQRPPSL
ncbi:hypothetical protein HY312_01545 [Candidatus Saccharibacteria bacterium]|nr:hypothetical protein [Candidatus Saccharibacteria bacterium]